MRDALDEAHFRFVAATIELQLLFTMLSHVSSEFLLLDLFVICEAMSLTHARLFLLFPRKRASFEIQVDHKQAHR